MLSLLFFSKNVKYKLNSPFPKKHHFLSFPHSECNFFTSLFPLSLEAYIVAYPNIDPIKNKQKTLWLKPLQSDKTLNIICHLLN